MGLPPATIHVVAVDVASEVAVDDSVNIDHREQDDVEPLLEVCREGRVAEQEFEYAVHEVGGPSLARMLPGSEPDQWLHFGLLLAPSADCHQREAVRTYRMGDHFQLHLAALCGWYVWLLAAASSSNCFSWAMSLV